MLYREKLEGLLWKSGSMERHKIHNETLGYHISVQRADDNPPTDQRIPNCNSVNFFSLSLKTRLITDVNGCTCQKKTKGIGPAFWCSER